MDEPRKQRPTVTPRNTVMVTYEDAGGPQDPPGVYGYWNIWFGWGSDWSAFDQLQINGPKTPEAEAALKAMCAAFDKAVAATMKAETARVTADERPLEQWTMRELLNKGPYFSSEVWDEICRRAPVHPADLRPQLDPIATGEKPCSQNSTGHPTETTSTTTEAMKEFHLKYCAEKKIHPVTLMPLDGSPAPPPTPYPGPIDR